jgi:RNA polymerase-interacting CarD/CdnL/TRCF family regulator
MQIKIGDWVVHPQQGVGRVVKLGLRDFGSGEEQQYYEIAIPTGTIWVPVDGPEDGLRKVTEKVDLAKYRVVLGNSPTPLASDYRQRQALLIERLRLNSFRAQCELLRDLRAHSRKTPLNETSREILRRMQRKVRDEWAMAAGKTPREATEEIEDLLRRGRKTEASGS